MQPSQRDPEQPPPAATELRVELRLEKLALALVGMPNPPTPVAMLVQSGVLDLSKPGDVIKRLPGLPPVIADAGGDRIMLDLMKLPKIAKNERLRKRIEVITSVLTVHGVETDEGLAECDFGVWDGLTFGEVRDRWPDELAAWLGSDDVAPPGGESFATCRDRVLEARARVVDRSPGARVLVVAHVTPIKILVADAVGAPLGSLYRMELSPCSISTLAWFPDGNASMFSFAESGHLRDVSAPAGT